MTLWTPGEVPTTTEGRYALAKAFFERGRERAANNGAPAAHCLLDPAEERIVHLVEREWYAVWDYEFIEKRKGRKIH